MGRGHLFGQFGNRCERAQKQWRSSRRGGLVRTDCVSTWSFLPLPFSPCASDARERSTLDQYRQHVRLHIGPNLGRIKLASLTPTQIENFRDNLLATVSRPLARKV